MKMFTVNKQQLAGYREEMRVWQGIPGIEVTPKGRIFCCFYSGGTTEMNGNYCIIVQSDDGGRTFSEPIAAAYAGEEHRCFDPVLWRDPLGRLWFTWSVMPDHGLYGVICDDPDAPTLSWSEAFLIGHDVMMNKPIVLSTGEWLFPLAVWDFPRLRESWRNKTQQPGAFVYRTSDNGKTFQKLGAVQMPNRSFDEHMVVELRDGRLMMWVRMLNGIGVSYSWDRGNSWSAGKRLPVKSPSSRFYIGRLNSGRLLLINHKNFTGRNNLTAMLSDDEGETWTEGLLLDERSGVSYPDVTQTADGRIYIVYDHGRGGYKKRMEDAIAEDREILFAAVTEEDVLAGELVSEGSSLKNVVSRLGKYCGPENPFHTPQLYDDESYAKWLLETYTGEEILHRVFDAYPLACADTETAHALDAAIAAFADADYSGQQQLTALIAKIRGAVCADAPVLPILETVCKAAEASVSEPFSLQVLADRCGISRFYLPYAFEKHTGTDVAAYFSELRLTVGKRFLLQTDKDLGSVAESCGFESAADFTEVFTRSVGISPVEYRALHKK